MLGFAGRHWRHGRSRCGAGGGTAIQGCQRKSKGVGERGSGCQRDRQGARPSHLAYTRGARDSTIERRRKHMNGVADGWVRRVGERKERERGSTARGLVVKRAGMLS